MAKALLGHVGLGPDARLAAEVSQLRSRLGRLAADNQRLRETNEALVQELALARDLASGVTLHEEMLSLSGEGQLAVDESVAEPAYS